MTNRKRDVPDFPAISFDEALGRLLQTDPKELVDVFKQNRKLSDEIERSVDERRERLRAATRGPKKKFRL